MGRSYKTRQFIYVYYNLTYVFVTKLLFIEGRDGRVRLRTSCKVLVILLFPHYFHIKMIEVLKCHNDYSYDCNYSQRKQQKQNKAGYFLTQTPKIWKVLKNNHVWKAAMHIPRKLFFILLGILFWASKEN